MNYWIDIVLITDNAIGPIRMFKYLLLKSIFDVSDIDVVERSKYDMSFKYFLDMAPEDAGLKTNHEPSSFNVQLNSQTKKCSFSVASPSEGLFYSNMAAIGLNPLN